MRGKMHNARTVHVIGWLHSPPGNRRAQSRFIKDSFPLIEDRLEISSGIARGLCRATAYHACKKRLAGLQGKKSLARYHGKKLESELHKKEKRAHMLEIAVAQEQKSGFSEWNILDTDLRRYATAGKYSNPKPPRFDFLKHLEAMLHEGTRVLDVGVGTGCQWLGILGKYRGKMVFRATTLTNNRQVLPEIRGAVKICTAAELHNKFEPGFFNIVVSHYGMHFQLAEAVRSSLIVLQPSGEIIFSGGPSNREDFFKCAHDTRFYRVLASDPPDVKGHWFLHLQKK